MYCHVLQYAQKSVTGGRQYCVGHMAEHGLSPAITYKCKHPECVKQAVRCTTGAYDYCRGHMKVVGGRGMTTAWGA